MAQVANAALQRADALVGRTLSDRYRIMARLAMGGMGSVYRADHVHLGKHVAVKVLHPEVEDFPELVARFEREAVAGAHVHHPNVATAIDFGVFDEGSRFLVLELVTGETLRAFLDRGPLPPPRACRIARHVAAGLAAVHKKGIVHRDLKPSNIMLVDDTRETRRFRRDRPGDMDVVKLIDFGLARVPLEMLSRVAQDADGPESALTRTGTVVGTTGYLAPEAALGTGSITAQSDLYALGVVLYEMLCGVPPFEGKTPVEMFAHHRFSAVLPLAKRNPAVRVPANIEAIVMRLLEKDPADRFPSAEALVAALDAALAVPTAAPVSLRQPSPVPVTITYLPTQRAVNRSGALWVVAACAIVATGIAIVAIGGRGAQPTVVTAPETPAPTVAADHESSGESARVDAKPSSEAKNDPQASLARIAELVTQHQVLDADAVDILYDLAVREQATANPLARPSTPGAHARALLARPEVFARGSAAMRVAYDLFRASCQYRSFLLVRAGQEGDDRALEILRAMQRPACAQTGGCCHDRHHELERAIAAIQARLRR